MSHATAAKFESPPEWNREDEAEGDLEALELLKCLTTCTLAATTRAVEKDSVS